MLEAGIKRIYEEDFENQKHFIDVICEKVREGMNPQILFDVNAFFVPNKDYMKQFFGPEITLSNWDCYDVFGDCKWTGHLLVPIRDIDGKVRGFSGYNPAVTLEKKNDNSDRVFEKMSKYKESAKTLLDKSRFFLCPLGFKKAMEDGYIILVDGFFDSLSVAGVGYNSMALLGSSLTDEIKFCLSFIDRIYVAYDNDLAGDKLYKTIKRSFPNCFYIKQSKCKDIDEFSKKYPSEFIEGLSQINSDLVTSIDLGLNKFYR